MAISNKYSHFLYILKAHISHAEATYLSWERHRFDSATKLNIMVSKITQARVRMIYLVGVIVAAENDIENGFVQFTVWRSHFLEGDCLKLCAKDENCTVTGRVTGFPQLCFVSDSLRLQDPRSVPVNLYFKKESFLKEGITLQLLLFTNSF